MDVRIPLKNLSGFSTSGVLRSIDAQQILKAVQVGALSDICVELNVYHLFEKNKV